MSYMSSQSVLIGQHMSSKSDSCPSQPFEHKGVVISSDKTVPLHLNIYVVFHCDPILTSSKLVSVGK